MVYRLIDEESQRQPVFQLCPALGVARSGFYQWQHSPVSDRQIADWLLTEQIRAIFQRSDETYGRRACTPSCSSIMASASPTSGSRG